MRPSPSSSRPAASSETKSSKARAGSRSCWKIRAEIAWSCLSRGSNFCYNLREILMTRIADKDMHADFQLLLDRVVNGEEIAITRDGQEIAHLLPISNAKKSMTPAEAIDELRRLRV